MHLYVAKFGFDTLGTCRCPIACSRNLQAFSQDSKQERLLNLNEKGICSLLQKSHGLAQGKLVHSCTFSIVYKPNKFLENLLVNMYGKCGDLRNARVIFDAMPERNVFSWNILIASYIQHGNIHEAFHLFNQMELEGVKKDVVSWNVIISAYVQQGNIDEAYDTFLQMQTEGFVVDPVSWNTMIAAYAQDGRGKEALQLFQQMQVERIKPDKVTFISLLSGLSSLESLAGGKIFHANIVNSNFHLETVVNNALLHMYSKCGDLQEAQSVFNKMHEKDISTWNTLLTGYVQHGENKYTLYLFHQIQKEIKPDRVAFLPALSACINLSGLEEGKLIHSRIIAHSLMSDVIVCTSLVNMYAKCGSLEGARAVFSIMQHEDVIAWNAILAACAQHGEDLEAFKLFQEMQREGINPNKVTFVNILGPFGGLALLTQGRLAHTVIVKARFNSDVVIGNALINMYGKGGSLEDALAIFEEMPQRDLVTWNAVILAYARHGMGYEVLQLLHWMHWEGAKPDEVTLVNILSACSHAGLLNEAQHYFVSMSKDDEFTLGEEHYGCIVDHLGRTGWLKEAQDFMDHTPFQLGFVACTAMLGACGIHGDLQLGRHVTEEAVQFMPDSGASYILLSNLYAAACM